MDKKRILFVLAGLHRVNRGAEVAFEAIAREMAIRDDCDVTMIGSGQANGSDPYKFVHAGCIARERFHRWPRVPVFYNEYVWEELSFIPGLLRKYNPADYDATIGCSYPFCNWALLKRKKHGKRPVHVYVTENGDWPAYSQRREYKYFGCDGLVCTNPEYYERNQEKWNAILIPNGVDPDRFTPGAGDRAKFGLPEGVPVALMVSALIPSKRVIEGIRYAAAVPDLHIVVAGTGPLKEEVEVVGKELLGERFQRRDIPRDDMPDLYRSADLFLHMSLDEPSANAYIEALATGLPVVTTDRMVTQWTFEDQAVLVDTTDEAAVVDGVKRALTLKQAEHIQSRRDLVDRRFRWSVITDNYCQFIDRIITERNG